MSNSSRNQDVPQSRDGQAGGKYPSQATSRCTGSQIDEASAIAALGGNADLLRELGTMFCEDAPQVLSELQQAVSDGNSTAARRAAHSLKGLAATFFARHTCEIALRMENEAAEGNLSALERGGIDRLKDSVAELRNELKQRGLVA